MAADRGGAPGKGGSVPDLIRDLHHRSKRSQIGSGTARHGPSPPPPSARAGPRRGEPTFRHRVLSRQSASDSSVSCDISQSPGRGVARRRGGAAISREVEDEAGRKAAASQTGSGTERHGPCPPPPRGTLHHSLANLDLPPRILYLRAQAADACHPQTDVLVKFGRPLSLFSSTLIARMAARVPILKRRDPCERVTGHVRHPGKFLS